nr:MAG TPA: hypothetical protein [Caudoviricetes sp.]
MFHFSVSFFHNYITYEKIKKSKTKTQFLCATMLVTN